MLGTSRTARPVPHVDRGSPAEVESCELEKSSALASLQNKVSEMWCSSSMGALKWHHHQRGHGGPPPEAEQLLPHWIECSCFCRRWKSCELERAVLCASLQKKVIDMWCSSSMGSLTTTTIAATAGVLGAGVCICAVLRRRSCRSCVWSKEAAKKSRACVGVSCPCVKSPALCERSSEVVAEVRAPVG